MDENQQLYPLSIVTLQDEDGTEVDYEIDAIYFGGLTIDQVVGTDNDTADKLTLKGLRKRIDSFVPLTSTDIADILG